MDVCLWWHRVSVLAFLARACSLRSFNVWCATKPWLWFLLFDLLLPPSSIPCTSMFTNPPSLPVGQSEERSDGSSSVSGAGAGPGESYVSPASDLVATLGLRHKERLFIFVNRWRVTIATHLDGACVATIVLVWSFSPGTHKQPLFLSINCTIRMKLLHFVCIVLNGG